MQTAGNNEEKRNKTWRIVMIAATALIIVIAVYFLYRGFLGNPLEGKWMHDESDLTLEIGRDNTAVLTWNELLEDKELKVTLNYALNKKAKQITFRAEREALAKSAEAIGGDATADKVESAISSILTSFNYNLEAGELTMTEWDYGEQYVFTRMK